MARTIYNLMQKSIGTDSSGNKLPDGMTFNLNNFEFTNPSSEYELTEKDVYRFDQVILKFYNSVNYYQEMVLLLNNIPFLTEDYIGEIIYLPLKEDLDNYYINNRKQEV